MIFFHMVSPFQRWEVGSFQIRPYRLIIHGLNFRNLSSELFQGILYQRFFNMQEEIYLCSASVFMNGWFIVLESSSSYSVISFNESEKNAAIKAPL